MDVTRRTVPEIRYERVVETVVQREVVEVPVVPKELLATQVCVAAAGPRAAVSRVVLLAPRRHRHGAIACF